MAASGDPSRRRHPTGARMNDGVVLHPRDARGTSGGGVSGPDSPFSTLRHGSQASEDLPWGSSPPSQSSEPIESSKTDLDGIAGKNYRGRRSGLLEQLPSSIARMINHIVFFSSSGRRVSRDRLSRDMSVGRNGASIDHPPPASGPILR